METIELFTNVSSFESCTVSLHHSQFQLGLLGLQFNPVTDLIECRRCKFRPNTLQSTVEIILSEHRKFFSDCPYATYNLYVVYRNAEESLLSETESLRSCSEDFGLGPSLRSSISSNCDSNGSGLKKSHDRNAILHEKKSCNNSLNNLCVEDFSSEFMKTLKSITERLKKNRETEFDANCASSRLDNVDGGLHDSKDNASNCQIDCIKEMLNYTDIVKNSKHPIMSSSKERRETFRGQEHKYSHCERAKIDDFVKAGLFFVGPEDNVRCFFCDGGLRNVQAHNVPFDEHKKWFPHCQFILYLEKNGVTCQPQEQLHRDDVDGMNVVTRTAAPSNPVRRNTSFESEIRGRVLEGREVKARLETPVIQALLSQGYQREVVKRAIERHFLLTGDDFHSVVELVQDILDVEGEKGMPGYEDTSNNKSASRSSASGQDNVDGARSSVASVVKTAATKKPVVKDEWTKILEEPVSEAVMNIKPADVHAALRNQSIEDEEIRRLYKEYEQLSQVRSCKICLDSEINTVFLPCGHFVTCDKCSPKISHCCICRALIRGTVRALTALPET